MMKAGYYDAREVQYINSIIANLYDDELDIRTRILNFYHALSNLIYFDRIAIDFFYKDKTTGKFQKQSTINLNWEDQMKVQVKEYDNYYCSIDDTLPLFYKNDTILFRCTDMFDVEKRKQTAYYKEYLEPNDCIYALEGAIRLADTNELHGMICLFRGQDKQNFTTEELNILKLFQPHLSNVLKHYGEAKNADKAMAPSYLADYDSIGFAIYNSRFEVKQCSDSFMTITEKYAADHVKEQLSELLMSCCRKKGDAYAKSSYKLNDVPIFVEFSKIADPMATDHGSNFGCVVYDLSVVNQMSLKQVKEEFALTSAEYKVLATMFEGKSNAEIGEELFLSISTVKKYTSSIYGKLGVSNYKQLMNKVLSIS